MTQIPRVKKAQKLPVVLSREEIRKLFTVTINLKFKSMFMIAYSAGLRVNEITHLKVSDIDSEQMQILVREGKGKVDRYSLLSEVKGHPSIRSGIVLPPISWRTVRISFGFNILWDMPESVPPRSIFI